MAGIVFRYVIATGFIILGLVRVSQKRPEEATTLFVGSIILSWL